MNDLALPAPRLSRGSGPSGRRRVHLIAALILLAVIFSGAGLLGIYRYVNNFSLYRGYAPPKDPSFVKVAGATQTISVASPALGGRTQQVIVYTPPGYQQHPQQHYPVFYVLHGFPGRPDALLLTVRLGVMLDVLMAQHRIQPMILVMPFGSTSTFSDKEWANGIAPNQGWETFVARDLVKAIDHGYRTIPTGAGRAIGGLSEGGYGALNIALHHPGEFRVIESWSGYTQAMNVHSVFGGNPRLLAYNSPAQRLPAVAGALRRAGTFVWFYSGTQDPLRTQNAAFAAELARYGIRYRYFTVGGGHNWRTWRADAGPALLAAAGTPGL
jgi:enterochelin esterase-like enzyme